MLAGKGSELSAPPFLGVERRLANAALDRDQRFLQIVRDAGNHRCDLFVFVGDDDAARP